MAGQNLEYGDGAERRYVGYLVEPKRPNGAGVLVAHGAPGLSDHERTVAHRLADLGYAVLAADYHGDGVLLDGPATGARMQALLADPGALRDALSAALAALGRYGQVPITRTAAIGYCFGGYGVLELGRGGADVPAIVGFHSILPIDRPEDACAIRGKVLILNGVRDPYVSIDARAAFERQMVDADVDWQMMLFGRAQHAFTNDQASSYGRLGIAYDAASDARAWSAMLTLFGETIDRHPDDANGALRNFAAGQRERSGPKN
jgi:dienelactone hydrolase